MPIKFISLDKSFIDIVKTHGYEGYVMKIQDYKLMKFTYYISPANSFCFMDGGIDMALSRIIFPGIEPVLKNIVAKLNRKTLLDRFYLPIGSSIIIKYDDTKALVASPTMLFPQNVSKTKNAYYATMATLYNILINQKNRIEDIDIIFTSFCCGYGKMSYEESFKQILQGIKDYQTYNPVIINHNIILKEPNLNEQPKVYANSEWFDIN